jgi:hypothetical protein
MQNISPYIVAIVVAWALSHLTKYLIAWRQGIRQDFAHQLFISGGMPSSHSATSIALWAVILLKDGVESGLFGLATLFALIVLYDAVKVRRSSGEQGQAITQLIRETKSKIDIPRAAKGHTPLEVIAGGLLGLVVGAIVFFAAI